MGFSALVLLKYPKKINVSPEAYTQQNTSLEMKPECASENMVSEKQNLRAFIARKHALKGIFRQRKMILEA